NLEYYLNEDWKALVGHRYLGGKHAFAVGTELAGSLGNGFMGAAFLEGRAGESDFHGVWGGVRVYWGQEDKSPSTRHHEDNSNSWSVDTLFNIINSYRQKFTPPACPSGEVLADDVCVRTRPAG